jgi:hypothetical protein
MGLDWLLWSGREESGRHYTGEGERLWWPGSEAGWLGSWARPIGARGRTERWASWRTCLTLMRAAPGQASSPGAAPSLAPTLARRDHGEELVCRTSPIGAPAPDSSSFRAFWWQGIARATTPAPVHPARAGLSRRSPRRPHSSRPWVRLPSPARRSRLCVPAQAADPLEPTRRRSWPC